MGPWRWWQTWTRAQWLIAIGLCPLLLALGLPISLSGPLANLLAVPWISLVVLPPALLGTLLLPVPYVGEGLLWLAGGLIDWLFRGLALVAGQVPAWMPAAVPLWAWVPRCHWRLFAVAARGRAHAPVGLAAAVVAGISAQADVAGGQAEVWQLDVGQGLAILVRTRHHTLLYDAGPRFGELDLGERVVLPALRKLGVKALDLMLISHAHADHAGGAQADRQRVAGEAAWSVANRRTCLPSCKPRACESGRQWTWDGVRVPALAMASGRRQQPELLRVADRSQRRTVAADWRHRHRRRAGPARQPVGRAHRLAAVATPRQSQFIIAWPCLTPCNPKAALISRGQGNAFGHPHPTVMARYRKRGMAIYDSAEQGAIRLQLGQLQAAVDNASGTAFLARSAALNRRALNRSPTGCDITVFGALHPLC